MRKNLFTALLALGVLLQTSPVPLHVWDLEPAGLAPVLLPAGTVPVEPVTRTDFDGSGPPERLVLTGNHLRIVSGTGIVWQSPSDWSVLQAEITDLNRDGMPEAALLVWRPFRPWPVDKWLPYGGRIAGFHDDQGNSCHIILIGWSGGRYREMWAGSALAEPVRSFAVADLNGDALQEMVTLEGSYAQAGLSAWLIQSPAPAHSLKVWEWNGFGFSVVSVIAGTFDELALVRAETGHVLILSP